MAFNFVKLTQRGGKPVYINIDHDAEALCKQIGLDYYIKDSLRTEMMK